MLKLFIVLILSTNIIVSICAQEKRWVLIQPSIEKIRYYSLPEKYRISFHDKWYVILNEEDAFFKSQFSSISLDHSLQINLPKSILWDWIQRLKPIKIEPDYPIVLNEPLLSNPLIPSTTKPSQVQVASPLAWHLEQLQFSELKKISTGKGVLLAVLDTGTDYLHTQLKSQIWINRGEIPQNNVDDEGNGYIDDCLGYNFVENNNDPMDQNAHGTHVSGLIAAQSLGVGSGIAPGSQIMPIRIIGHQPTFISDASKGIKYAVDNGAQILVNSWRILSTDEDQFSLLKEALFYAEQKEVLFLTATGNESLDLDHPTLSQPKVIPAQFTEFKNLIAVSATDRQNALATYSNYGFQTVPIAAPGTQVLSTVPHNNWRQMSGTSMATPLVAGVLALGIELKSNHQPLIIKDTLLQTSLLNSSLQNKVHNGLINPLIFLKNLKELEL